jgi:hypothetical protein
MTVDDDDDLVFDRAYLRRLLTEVRPDITIEDFKHYANLPDDVVATLLAEVVNHGDAEICPDEFNAPIICLTPLGAHRARVRLSCSHPPIWVSLDDKPPPMIAAQQAGFILFTDLESVGGEGYSQWSDTQWVDGQADPDQLEPVEILVNVEEFSEWLLTTRRLPNGEFIPESAEFCFWGADRSWPRSQPDPATAETPSASTWQEQFTRCPFCRNIRPGQVCKVCHNHAPARRCPDCDGRKMGFVDLCLWCQRSGIDHILPRADVAQARRKPDARKKPKKRAKR